jgi:hypothetical protein
MLVLLRIAVVVGVIFWLSPLRQPWDSAEAPHAAGEPSSSSSRAGVPDRDRIGHLIQAWERLPPEGHAAVRDIAGRLPGMAGHAPQSAADMAGAPAPSARTGPARKPGG